MNQQHNERTEVELPFLRQLESMGWTVLDATGESRSTQPHITKRESFRDVLLTDRLREAMRKINRNEQDEEWLDEGRISQAISALERHGRQQLMEANAASTEMLIKGTVVDGVSGWDGGRGKTVHFIEWNHLELNDFLAVSQFRLDVPSGYGKPIIPDMVLFVNGIPLAVVECKSPVITEPMQEAITQLLCYSNQRAWVEGDEGNEKLFHPNQIMVATCFDKAAAGTICSGYDYYVNWRDTSPVPTAEVAAALGRNQLSKQELLVAGMLRPAHLLDIVRHFNVFMDLPGKRIKAVTRYHQFRAVHRAVHRLLTGQTRRQDGEFDRRGGIIWHTQGSGKSLTMVFLVRKIRSIPELRRFKVVMVTDRTDLQDQLSSTAALTGETVQVARNSRRLRRLLAEEGPGIVFAMVQKYQDRDGGGEELADDEAPEPFPVLNESEDILLLVDEAHRSQGSILHANLCRALPNAAKIGFTGTPIIMSGKKRTEEIFGTFIDTYTLREAEEDGVIVPIVYEGRTAETDVEARAAMDERFEDMCRVYTPAQRETIKRKYATEGDVLEAPKMIEAKARNMLQHYVENVLPDGLKAQVVAHTRKAAVRYREAFVKVRDELVQKLETLPAELQGLSEDVIAELPHDKQLLARAFPFRDELKAIEFAVVISAKQNDDPAWAEWTDEVKIKAWTDRFKKPLRHEDPQKRDPLAFLIVKRMLLTGFDAPIERVLYLDRVMKEHELLQAIARVNRTYSTKEVKKSTGIVVDYYGVAQHLKEALAAYEQADQIEITDRLRSMKDEIPKLAARHERVVQVFAVRGIKDIHDTLACVDLLADEKIRAEFTIKLRQFLETFDLILPRPAALDYVSAVKTLGFIYYRTRNRYRDDQMHLAGVGNKVRKLIDEHVIVNGINPKIPPISIHDAGFDNHISREASDRAKASEMEHALRYHIRKHFDEDPARYRKLSEQLDEILKSLEGNWEDVVTTLHRLTSEVKWNSAETSEATSIYGPFSRLLIEALGGEEQLPEAQRDSLKGLAADIVDHIRQEVALVDFWHNYNAQTELRSWIVRRMDDSDFLDQLEKLQSVADQMIDVAKANHHRLLDHERVDH